MQFFFLLKLILKFKILKLEKHGNERNSKKYTKILNSINDNTNSHMVLHK